MLAQIFEQPAHIKRYALKNAKSIQTDDDLLTDYPESSKWDDFSFTMFNLLCPSDSNMSHSSRLCNDAPAYFNNSIWLIDHEKPNYFIEDLKQNRAKLEAYIYSFYDYKNRFHVIMHLKDTIERSNFKKGTGEAPIGFSEKSDISDWRIYQTIDAGSQMIGLDNLDGNLISLFNDTDRSKIRNHIPDNPSADKTNTRNVFFQLGTGANLIDHDLNFLGAAGWFKWKVDSTASGITVQNFDSNASHFDRGSLHAILESCDPQGDRTSEFSAFNLPDCNNNGAALDTAVSGDITDGRTRTILIADTAQNQLFVQNRIETNNPMNDRIRVFGELQGNEGGEVLKYEFNLFNFFRGRLDRSAFPSDSCIPELRDSTVTVYPLDSGTVILKGLNGQDSIFIIGGDTTGRLIIGKFAMGDTSRTGIFAVIKVRNKNDSTNILTVRLAFQAKPLPPCPGPDSLVSTANRMATIQTDMDLVAQAEFRRVRLDWICKQATDDSKFVIQKANRAGLFFDYLPVSEKQPTSSMHFMAYDNQATEGGNLYRIKRINALGQRSFSNAQKVYIQYATGFRVFPNPTDDIVSLDLQNYLGLSVQVSLYNWAGQEVLQQKLESVGSAPLTLYTQGLPQGYYIVRVSSKSKRDAIQKLVIAR